MSLPAKLAIGLTVALATGWLGIYFLGTTFLVEEKEITRGSLNGLAIGMDRAQVLAVVKHLGARVISPSVCNTFQISKTNVADLPSLPSLEGIRVTNGQGQYMAIYFSGDHVSKIDRTPGSNVVGVKVGDGTDAVREKVLRTLELQDGGFVTPIVNFNDDGPLPVENVSSTTALDLAVHKCWLFEVNSVAPAGSVYVLQFGATGLERVSYRRPRIRAE